VRWGWGAEYLSTKRRESSCPPVPPQTKRQELAAIRSEAQAVLRALLACEAGSRPTGD